MPPCIINLFYYIATVIKDIVSVLQTKAWKGGTRDTLILKSFFMSLHEFNRREKGSSPLISKTYRFFFLQFLLSSWFWFVSLPSVTLNALITGQEKIPGGRTQHFNFGLITSFNVASSDFLLSFHLFMVCVFSYERGIPYLQAYLSDNIPSRLSASLQKPGIHN